MFSFFLSQYKNANVKSIKKRIEKAENTNINDYKSMSKDKLLRLIDNNNNNNNNNNNDN